MACAHTVGPWETPCNPFLCLQVLKIFISWIPNQNHIGVKLFVKEFFCEDMQLSYVHNEIKKMTWLLRYMQPWENPTVNNIKRWFAGKNDSSTKYLISSDVPSIILFIFSYRLRALNTLFFYFCEFMKKKKKKSKQFLQRILKEIIKKKNTWHIGRLVDKSFVLANQKTSVL